MVPELGIFGNSLAGGSGDTYQLAIQLLIISFAFAGICIGVGKAFQFRRLESFGKEEFAQAVIGALMIGSLAVLATGMIASFDLASVGSMASINATSQNTNLSINQTNLTGPCRALIGSDEMQQAAKNGEALGMAVASVIGGWGGFVGGLGGVVATAGTGGVAAPTIVAGAAGGAVVGSTAGATLVYMFTPVIPKPPPSNITANNPLIGALIDDQQCYSSVLNQQADKNRFTVMILSALSTAQVGIVVVDVTPLKGFEIVVDEMSGDISDMKSLANLADEETWILTFVDSAAFKLFLPLGLLFRLFFPTRKLGGVIMAMAVSAYVIYPLLMVISSTAFMQSMLSSNMIEAPVLSSACIAPNASAQNQNNTSNQQLNLNPVDVFSKAISGAVGSVVQSIATPIQCMSDSLNTISKIDQAIASTAQFVLVYLPLFCFVLSLIAVWPLAEVFGGEYHLEIGGMI